MARHTVLVVDDEPDVLTAFTAILEARLPHVRILTAPGAHEALAILDKEKVDLAVVDHRMPRMTGLGLLEHMKSDRPELKTIMVSAYADLDLPIDALNKGGVVGFFRKPVDPEVLVCSIREVLTQERRRQAREGAMRRALSELHSS